MTETNTIIQEDASALSAVKLVKVHGIIAIIIGSLSILASAFLLTIMVPLVESVRGASDASETVSVLTAIAIIGLVQSVYFIASGTALIRKPKPSTAKALIIINLITSMNTVIIIFAIINLTKSADYARGYAKLNK